MPVFRDPNRPGATATVAADPRYRDAPVQGRIEFLKRRPSRCGNSQMVLCETLMERWARSPFKRCKLRWGTVLIRSEMKSRWGQEPTYDAPTCFPQIPTRSPTDAGTTSLPKIRQFRTVRPPTGNSRQQRLWPQQTHEDRSKGNRSSQAGILHPPAF